MTTGFYVNSNGCIQAVSAHEFLGYLYDYNYERIDNDYVVHLGREFRHNESYLDSYFG